MKLSYSFCCWRWWCFMISRLFSQNLKSCHLWRLIKFGGSCGALNVVLNKIWEQKQICSNIASRTRLIYRCDLIPSLVGFSELGCVPHFWFRCKGSVKKALRKATLSLEVLPRRVSFEETFKKLTVKGGLNTKFKCTEFKCMHF